MTLEEHIDIENLFVGKLYEHKAICEYCKEQEYDGTWIRKNGALQFHYICFRCIESWFIQNDC